MIRSLGFKLLIPLVGIVFGLVVVELGVRAAPSWMLPSEFRIVDRAFTGRVKWQEMMVGDPFLGYRYKPDLDVDFPSEGITVDIRTTSHGLGDIGFRDIGTAPPFDAIALGDSFTFCDDVRTEDCWVKQVGDATGLSFATLGISGFSTLAEARVLERYGHKLNPKLVVLAVFPNDFNDNIDFDEWIRSGAENFWEWRGRREGRGPLFRRLADHSIVVRIIDSAIRTRERRSFVYKDEQFEFVFQPWWLEPMDAERREHRRRGWELMRAAILEMRAASAAMGARFMVVTIPSKEEVYWDLVRDGLPNPESLEVDRPFVEMFELCAAEGIACCDTRADLEAEAHQGRQLYLRVSSHWNADGNAVAAAAVARCLEERGWDSATAEERAQVEVSHGLR